MTDIPATVEAEQNLEVEYDASDPAAVNKARQKSSRTRRARLEFVEGMLTLPQGRAWLFNLMDKCFIFGNAVVQNDTHATYFNLGQQNIGKLVLQDVQAFPELYVTMINENK